MSLQKKKKNKMIRGLFFIAAPCKNDVTSLFFMFHFLLFLTHPRKRLCRFFLIYFHVKRIRIYIRIFSKFLYPPILGEAAKPLHLLYKFKSRIFKTFQ